MVSPQPDASIKQHVLKLSDFPPYVRSHYGSIIHMITTYLRQLLERHQQHNEQPGLVIPSITELSGHFHCTELDILESFHELRRQGYEYEIQGVDLPICYYDPLARMSQPAESQSLWSSIVDMWNRFPATLKANKLGSLKPS